MNSKYISTTKTIVEEKQEDIVNEFQPFDPSDPNQTSVKVTDLTYEHKSPIKETDIIKELKGDSPLEDHHPPQTKIKNTTFQSITSVKSPKKSAIIKFENSAE